MYSRPIRGMLVLPSCIVVLIEAINSIVNFRPFQNQIVKDFVQHSLSHVQFLPDLIAFINE